MSQWMSFDDARKALAELVATFTFVFVGVGAAGAALTVAGGSSIAFFLIVGLAHGLGIMIGIATVGRISGAHMNPAVTFSAVITGNIGLVRGALFILAQMAGSVLAMGFLKGILFPGTAALGVHQIAGTITPGEGVLIEILLTFFLVWAVFASAFDRRGVAPLTPFVIGMVVAVAHFVAIPLTGASLNPARSFGPAAVFGDFTNHWVYWLGPFAGGGLAALVYIFVFGDRESQSRVLQIKMPTKEPESTVAPVVPTTGKVRRPGGT